MVRPTAGLSSTSMSAAPEPNNLMISITKPTPKCARQMSDLSDEVLENIFQYVSESERQHASKVCSRWASIIQQIPKAYKFEAGTELAEIVRILNEHPNTIRSLELSHLETDIALILRKIRCLQSKLESLHIDSCDVIRNSPNISGHRIKKLLTSCKELRTVTLMNVSFALSNALDAFAKLNYLSCLTIGNNPFITPVDLLTLILNCGHLESLHLYRIANLCDQHMRFMFGQGGRLSDQLRELTLDRVSELGPAAYDSILNCKLLHALRINYSTGLAPATVLRMPDELPVLRRLHLERVCRIGSSVLEQVFARTDKKLRLHEFTLIDCCTRFDDSTMRAMATSQSHSLVRLKLRNCLGLRDVSCLFQRFPSLREIDLSGCDSLHQLLPSTVDKGRHAAAAAAGDGTMLTAPMSSSITRLILPLHLRSTHGQLLSSSHALQVMFNGREEKEQKISEWDYTAA